MELNEILEKYERDYQKEKEILSDFSKVLKSEYTKKEIETTLDENGFNGVYMLDHKDYSQLKQFYNPGFYVPDKRIIVLDKSTYNKRFGIHEMGHAFINDRNIKEAEFYGEDYRSGIGLAEGAMTLLMSTKDVDKISTKISNYYRRQTMTFQQLNFLYEHTKLKEYPNLLVHFLKEPEKFSVLIRNIFKEVYKENYGEEENLEATRSALYTILVLDLITPSRPYDKELFTDLVKLTGLYGCLVDKKLRKPNSDKFPFVVASLCLMNSEDVLMQSIFGDCKYAKSRKKLIDEYLAALQNDVENIADNDSDFVFVKK